MTIGTQPLESTTHIIYYFLVNGEEVFGYDSELCVYRIGTDLFPRLVWSAQRPKGLAGLTAVFFLGTSMYSFDLAGSLYHITIDGSWHIQTVFDTLAEVLLVIQDLLFLSMNGVEGREHNPKLSQLAADETSFPGVTLTKEDVDYWVDVARHEAEGPDAARHPLTCSQSGCSAIPNKPFALKTHLYFHYNIKPFECKCSKVFHTRGNLKRHQASACKYTYREESVDQMESLRFKS